MAGMVMTFEPGMTYAPGKVMVHEENLVIREDGPQLYPDGRRNCRWFNAFTDE